MFSGGFFFDLPRRHPHDMDGVADHIGWALFAFGASRHWIFPGKPGWPYRDRPALALGVKPLRPQHSWKYHPKSRQPSFARFQESLEIQDIPGGPSITSLPANIDRQKGTRECPSRAPKFKLRHYRPPSLVAVRSRSSHAPQNLRRRKPCSNNRLPRTTSFFKITRQTLAFFGLSIASRVLWRASFISAKRVRDPRRAWMARPAAIWI